MKKEKVVYRYYPYQGKVLQAKKELPYEMKLTAQLILDEICFNWNKQQLEERINAALDEGNKVLFNKLSEAYRHFIWE